MWDCVIWINFIVRFYLLSLREEDSFKRNIGFVGKVEFWFFFVEVLLV